MDRDKLLFGFSSAILNSYEHKKIFITDSFTGTVVTVKDMVYYDI